MKYVTKEYLNKHYELLQQIKVDMDRYRYVVGLNSVSNDGQPRGSGNSNPTALQAERLEAMSEKINSTMARMNEENKEIEESINSNGLTPNEKRVMLFKYTEGLDWQEIIRLIYDSEMDFSKNIRRYYNRVYNIHSSALRKMIGLRVV